MPRDVVIAACLRAEPGGERGRFNGILTQHRPYLPHLRLLRSPLLPPPIASSLARVRAMFSTKLSRAAHRATTSHNAAAAITATSSTASVSTRATHQRRPSSSKASCPPDNNTAKPAPTAKADATEAQEAPGSGRTSPQKSSKGRARGGYRRVGQASNGNGNAVNGKQVMSEPVDQFAGLPSVPSLQGLDAKGNQFLQVLRLCCCN